ncbi:MAG: hypothetical protein M1819_004775 [Sarea resinae]|nr:MAG: hypothetical protein M1819_004775 [Sarea resinae]
MEGEWANPAGDDYFKRQRNRADSADSDGQMRLFQMMQRIGDELQECTGALSLGDHLDSGDPIQILDLCMAPGGYTACALKHNPSATACGITLAPEQGGHRMLLDPALVQTLYLDITLLAAEYDIIDPVPGRAPHHHPAQAELLPLRPFLEQQFQLVFCDGQVLRTHARAAHRAHLEPTRLTLSQLILALQRVARGGTVVMLLHKVEAPHTAALLARFDAFASVQLFKPRRVHAIRSSFYLVAKDVQPQCPAARAAVLAWKEAWARATFGPVGLDDDDDDDGTTAGLDNDNDNDGRTADDSIRNADERRILGMLEAFGPRLVELGRPVWRTQATALSRMKFAK